MNWFKKLFRKKGRRKSKTNDRPAPAVTGTASERMTWAIEKAHLTLNYFKKSLLHPQADQQKFSLKIRMHDGPLSEEVWLTEISFDESNIFYGRISTESAVIRNVGTGKEIGVPAENICDWMIVEEGRLIGGYTIRAGRDELDEKEKTSFDRKLGFIIDEGVDYFEHDFTTPEGAILSIEDAYDTNNIDNVIACKDFEAEARLLLSHDKHMERLATNPQIITETGESVKSTFIKFIDDYGFPCFKDVKRAFPIREFIREDLCIVTEICQYPDKTKSTERLYVGRKNGEWKVLSPVE